MSKREKIQHIVAAAVITVTFWYLIWDIWMPLQMLALASSGYLAGDYAGSIWYSPERENKNL